KVPPEDRQGEQAEQEPGVCHFKGHKTNHPARDLTTSAIATRRRPSVTSSRAPGTNRRATSGKLFGASNRKSAVMSRPAECSGNSISTLNDSDSGSPSKWATVA